MAVVVSGTLREVISEILKQVPKEAGGARLALRQAEKAIAATASLTRYQIDVGSARPVKKTSEQHKES